MPGTPLATRIPPLRAVVAEANIAYGPHPAGQVLLVGLALTLAAALSWAGRRDRLRQSAGFDVTLYAGGAAIVAALAFAFNLTDDWLPETWTFWQVALGFVAGCAALGVLRASLSRAGLSRPSLSRIRLALDVACAIGLALPLVAGLTV